MEEMHMMETATMANKLRSLAASIAEIADALSAQPSEQNSLFPWSKYGQS